MKKYLGVAACVAVFCSGAALAADPVAGKAKSKTCAACHGQDGNSAAADFPKLAGQNPDDLVKALKDYKQGDRKNAIMAPMAANLSVRDMEDLARSTRARRVSITSISPERREKKA